MTVFDIDGAHVIFEGLARLHWVPGPWRLQNPGAGDGARAAVLSHVWPRREELAGLRRQIEHGRRTVVVIDGREPVLTLTRSRVPHVPFGAVDVGGAPADSCRLSIPRFNWLGDRNRMRGVDFLSRVTGRQLPVGRYGECAIVIERGLLGTPEPLRFVFVEREMALGQLQLTIAHMFSTPPLAARPDAGGRTVVSPAFLAA